MILVVPLFLFSFGVGMVLFDKYFSGIIDQFFQLVQQTINKRAGFKNNSLDNLTKVYSSLQNEINSSDKSKDALNAIIDGIKIMLNNTSEDNVG